MIMTMEYPGSWLLATGFIVNTGFKGCAKGSFMGGRKQKKMAKGEKGEEVVDDNDDGGKKRRENRIKVYK